MDFFKPEFILSFLAAGVSGIVWLVRLEGKIKSIEDKCKMLKSANDNTQKDVDSVRIKQETVDQQLSLELKSIQVELAQIKGYLMHSKTRYSPKG